MKESEKATNKRASQRQLLDRFIDKPATFLVKHKIKPNILSLIGFSCSLAAAILIGFDGLHFPIWTAWIIPFLFFWSGVFDVFDGEVARRTEKISKAGAFLDSNLDRLSDAAIVLGLIFGGYFNYIIGFIILFMVIMISYIRSRAENEGVDMKGVGLMERAERLIILFLAFIIEFWVFHLTKIYTGIPFNLFFPLIFSLIYLGLLSLTIIQRLIHAFKALKEIDAPLTNQ